VVLPHRLNLSWNERSDVLANHYDNTYIVTRSTRMTESLGTRGSASLPLNTADQHHFDASAQISPPARLYV